MYITHVFLIIAFLTILAMGKQISVGVIRWDAWNQITDPTTKVTYLDTVAWYTRKTLTPAMFQYRLPFFAKVTDQGVEYNGDSQEVMDQEIEFASRAGISFFAFDTYCTFQRDCITDDPFCVHYISHTSAAYCPQNPAYGLSLYLSSSIHQKINFTLVILGAPVCRKGAVESYVDLMSHPQFHKTPEGRPMLFMFQFSDVEAGECGGWAGAKNVFDGLKSYAKGKGILEPYLVLMDFDPRLAWNHAQLLGFDAISTYALTGGDNSPSGLPFQTLADQAKQWWSSAESIGAPFVPIVGTGWDPRPRAENPNPFVDEGPQHYAMPTSQELQNLVSDAVKFTCNSPSTKSNTVIMYAWNESNENGAAIIPSLGNGTLYVDALGKLLPGQC